MNSNIQKHQTRKELESQLKKQLGDVEGLKTELNNKRAELKTKEDIVKNLRDKINQLNLSNQTPSVSEHALVRYFERVKGFNMEEIKKEILNDKVLKLMDVLGSNGEYPSESCKLVVKNNVVVTIK